MEPSLKGRTALVTGAAGDIGQAIALALAEAGADVALHDRERTPSISAAADSVAALGRNTIAVTGDVRDHHAVKIFVEGAITHFGKLDILVNNAGVMTEIPLLSLGLHDWQETIDTNLTGCFLCTRAASEHMIGRKTGSIINIASQLAYRGGVGLAHYSAAKAGILGFTRAAARELGPYGIRVNAVAPGPIESKLIAPYKTPEWLKAKFAASVLKRLGRPDEVAGSVVFLASDAASLYFGQTLSPNGGGVML
jgi:3-oxoacyl-[acyl-carrier protein] reductase